MPAKEKEEIKKKKRVRAVVEEVSPEPQVLPNSIEELAQKEPEMEPVNIAASAEPDLGKLETVLEEPQEEIKPINQDSKNQKINFKAFFLLTILIALVVGFISGGVYVYVSGLSTLDKPEPTPLATQTPEPTPEPTPEAMIDYKSFSVAIYNGSGKIGEAGKAEALLEGDFSIDEVGNADRFDYEETEIAVKSDVPEEVIEKITDLLSSNYEIVEADNLSSTSDYDIEITVGSLVPES